MRWYIEGLSEIDDTNERFRLLTIWKKETGEGEEASEEMERKNRKKKQVSHIYTHCFPHMLHSRFALCLMREKEAGKGGGKRRQNVSH